MKTANKLKSKNHLPQNAQQAAIQKSLKKFIVEDDHPCVMAQTVFSMDKVDLHVYENFGSKNAAHKILKDIKEYLLKYDFENNDFYTFVATFPDRKKYSEKQFEELLWKQLQFIHEADDQPWDPTVSSDPENKNFSFSIHGKAFYMVGLHPNSSRMARRSPVPAIAFNLHWQFDKLREMGAYHNVGIRSGNGIENCREIIILCWKTLGRKVKPGNIAEEKLEKNGNVRFFRENSIPCINPKNIRKKIPGTFLIL